MEQYLVIAKEAKAASNAGSMAFLTRHRWTIERWIKVSSTVTQGLMSASRAQVGDAAATATQDFDKQIKDVEAQLESAANDERAGLQAQLDGLKSARGMVGGMVGEVTDLDRRNAATLQRWLPRIEELNKAK